MNSIICDKRSQELDLSERMEPQPEKVVPISTDRVQVGGIVIREPITFSDKFSKKANPMRGRVVWVHPRGRFHVVKFGEGRQAVRECFMGVAR